jgi:hypothetical protein
MIDVQLVGLILTLIGLVLSIYYKFNLDKKHYALEMIREWNQQTAKDKIILEKAVPGIYEICSERLLKDKLSKIHNAASLKKEELKEGEKIEDYLAAKESTIRLLNYFEFVSSSYLNGAADKKIIQESFSGTMVRYYCVLNDYIKNEVDKTGRNPWSPYTKYVKSVVAPNSKYPLLTKCITVNKDGKLVCENNKIESELISS